jgi:hypothetical protein
MCLIGVVEVGDEVAIAVVFLECLKGLVVVFVDCLMVPLTVVLPILTAEDNVPNVILLDRRTIAIITMIIVVVMVV